MLKRIIIEIFKQNFKQCFIATNERVKMAAYVFPDNT